MAKSFNTVIIGGGCLGCAFAFSISRQLGRQQNKVAIIEKKVLEAGLSSRHRAIVRSAIASVMAARMAKIATQEWKPLNRLWGLIFLLDSPEQSCIANNFHTNGINQWQPTV